MVIGGSIAFTREWQERMALRGELDLVRSEVSELARLRVENDRLRAKQIPAPELEALRADHTALPRLRAELAALKKRAGADAP